MTVFTRKRKDGSIRYCVAVWHDGKTHWVGTFHTASEAHRAEEEFDPRGPAVWSVYSQSWLSRRVNISDTSRSHYAFNLSVATRYFGDRPLDTITPAMVEDMVASCGYSPKVVRSVVDMMRMVYRSAIRDGLAKSDPTQGLTNLPKRRAKRKVRALTDDEVRRVVAAAPMFHRAMFALWPLVGLRVGEMLGLTWSNVFDDHIQVEHQFTHGKLTPVLKSEASHRSVPLNNQAQEILERWRNQCPPSRQGLVFPTEQGYLINGAHLTRLFDKVRKDSGVDFVSHEMRHTFATNLLLAGVSPKVVATLMGHSNVAQTLNTYAHLLPKSDANAVDMLPRY